MVNEVSHESTMSDLMGNENNGSASAVSNSQLTCQIVPTWPKLAWVARMVDGEMQVFHGPMVEVRDQWLVEAVWDGDFSAGDFDTTELVFGSGIRLRGGEVVFVSAGTVFDRLWHVHHDGHWHVANTLPGLLTVTGLRLRDDYKDYSSDIRSIMKGLENRIRKIPTNGPDLASTYYHNLAYDGVQVREVAKPDTAPHFDRYETYRQYLTAVAARLGDNAQDAARKHRVNLLSTISSGYDSCVAAAISRHAGCQQAVTITQSSSLWRGSDTGAPIARHLGMECREYPRAARHYPEEAAIWAADGRPTILNWTLFDYLKPLSLLFTGCHGEKVWDRVDHDHPDPFVRRDPSSLGFTEYRLIQGAFQCPIPFWGVRHAQELRAITASEVMRPWCMGKDYDKPIARRLLEEEGVPRRAFGAFNKNTTMERMFRWPFSKDAMDSFSRYACRRGASTPPNWLVPLYCGLANADVLVYRNTYKRFGIRREWQKWWNGSKAHSMFFQWANHELQQRFMCLTSLKKLAEGVK